MFNKITFIVTFLGMCSINGFAARPFAVDDAGIVSYNRFEIEIGLNHWKDCMDGGVEIKHGITNRMDIGAGFGYVAVPKSESHISPMGVGFKYEVIPDLLSASFGAAFNDPAWAVNFILSQPFNEHFTFHTNLGMEVESFSTSGLLTYGILSTFQITKITVGVEVLGSHKKINAWQVGAQLAITDWLAFDVGISGNFRKNIEMTATSGLWFGF
jgi:hypothetical protein